MRGTAAARRLADGITTAALGVAEFFACILVATAMVFIVAISQIVRISQEQKERRAFASHVGTQSRRHV